jgi:hypothetical protein
LEGQLPSKQIGVPVLGFLLVRIDTCLGLCTPRLITEISDAASHKQTDRRVQDPQIGLKFVHGGVNHHNDNASFVAGRSWRKESKQNALQARKPLSAQKSRKLKMGESKLPNHVPTIPQLLFIYSLLKLALLETGCKEAGQAN